MSFALASIAVTSCGSSGQGQGQMPPPPDVDFFTTQLSSASLERKYPGNIEGTVVVDIKAQVSGYLDEIYVSEGEFVKKGDPIFKIKSDVYDQSVKNSDAAVKAAEAALASASLEVEKIRPLVAGKVVSEIQLKTAEANFEAAKAQLAQAKAMLGTSQINADFSLIKAPVSGFIGRIPNRIGNLVSPSDGTALTTLSQIDEVIVYFSISEGDFIAMQKAGKVEKEVAFVLADGSTYAHAGQLSPASGNIDRNTGSMTMKAVFPNPEKLLRSGGSGRIVVRETVDSTLLIPMGAVKDIQDKFFVFKLGDSSKVRMHPIEVDGRSGAHYLVKTGLAAGEKVATNRIDALYDGLEVVPTTQSGDSLSENQH